MGQFTGKREKREPEEESMEEGVKKVKLAA
jgi:hypothetical protein